MFPSPPASAMSNSETNSISSDFAYNLFLQSQPNQLQAPLLTSTTNPKKKRNLPGNPDPDAEVIALSPKSLLATNRFVCEVCNKGFQRDQNLQLHRRGHNLPWKLKQRNSKDLLKKRVFVCPEASCVHHHPSRALGDLTGIKKHFCRKHGEKKWKCDKCDKVYAVQSDWKAHYKNCGTREYTCDCGTIFSRKDSFITHRAFCDALAEESARLSATANHFTSSSSAAATVTPQISLFPYSTALHTHFANPPLNAPILSTWDPQTHHQNPNPNPNLIFIKLDDDEEESPHDHHHHLPNATIIPTTLSSLPQPQQQPHKAGVMITSPYQALHVSSIPAAPSSFVHLSATALLQKAATMGSATAASPASQPAGLTVSGYLGGAGDLSTWQKNDRPTRDFLGLTGDDDGTENHNVVNVKDLLTYAGGAVEFHHQNYDRLRGFGFADC